MKLKNLFIALCASLSLSACVSLGTQADSTNIYTTTAKDGQAVSIDVSELGNLKGALNNALGQVAEQLNKPTVLNNITSFSTENKTIEGKQYAILNFHTADGKAYSGRTDPTGLTQDKLEKLHKVRGATVIGAIPVQGQPNHFIIQDIKDFVF
ncbi:hypothetical protein A4G20_06825 [Pasteurellaceae bacterium RH1A]|nr:hypothetical protein A4G20_06825 [Pasteurellaceae bacterium RH1A]